jgi:hypothetical protein
MRHARYRGHPRPNGRPGRPARGHATGRQGEHQKRDYIVNQQLSNTSVARQTELARDAMSASASPTAPTRSTT